jgi:glycosyltransferase involved in cell wall biosynthesis
MAHERRRRLRQFRGLLTFAVDRRSVERMTSRLKVLYVAYPLLPLSEDIAGGAEQVLLTLASEVASRGNEVTIAAADDSIVPGRLLATGKASTRIDGFERRKAEHEAAILEHLASHKYDLVHDMSGSFWQQAGSIDAPMLATLHLPPEYYPSNSLWHAPNDLTFNGVSCSQARRFAEVLGVQGLEVVTNGVSVEKFSFTEMKQDYLLWLGRICEEKAPHAACEIVQRMGMPLVLAGQVYPFSYHQQYFDRELKAYLGSSNIQFVNPPTRAEKVELLGNARALLITSTAHETSSLVAMEAMACGTPVIAFRHGALPEVVRDSVTGFIADNPAGMCEAIEHIESIVPLVCREHVVRRFTAARMANDYLQLYQQLATRQEVQTAPVEFGILPQAA